MRNAAFGVAVAIACVLGAGAAEAKSCKTAAVSASNTQVSVMETARTQAVQAWTVKVYQQFGADWQDWTIADSPAQSCTASGVGFICSASAKPCKP